MKKKGWTNLAVLTNKLPTDQPKILVGCYIKKVT